MVHNHSPEDTPMIHSSRVEYLKDDEEYDKANLRKKESL